MGRHQIPQRLIEAAGWASLGVAVTLPFFFWGSDRAPEFYGSFAAAIVAALAVILTTSYQADLTRQRDNEIRQQELRAEATSLQFWLKHVADEMDFLTSIVTRMKTSLDESGKIDLPLDQLREVLSARFFDELPQRAKEASKLPGSLGEEIADILYTTFREADRVFNLRGAADSFRPSEKQLDEYLVVTKTRAAKLRQAAILIRSYMDTT